MSHRFVRRLLAVGCAGASLLIPAAVAWACVTPILSTDASSGMLGQGIHDVATLSNGDSPTGTISWRVYSASDTSCKTPLNTSALTVTVNGNGTYTSPDFTPSSLGSYKWVASYSGDTNNYSVTGKCGEAHEFSTIWKASPDLVSTASSGTVGGSINDQVTLSEGYSPTGTISWNVYGAGDALCGTPLNKTPLTVTVSGNGTYTSPGFTPSAPGSYQWVATYSGDGNNSQYASECGEDEEVSTVSPAAPALSSTASPGMAGGPIHDVVTLSGGYSPTGTISWNVYGAGDPLCKRPLNKAPLTASVNGDGTYTSPDFTASAAGSYQWVATYSGDGNNGRVASTCSDHSEVSTVSQAPPPPISPAPGIRVVKLERVGSSGAFRTGTITAKVGQRIEYEILVTNTGNTALTLSFSDPRCDSGTVRGPSALGAGLSGDVLSPGAEARYTCSHRLRAGDPSVFTNTATVTGQPPAGPPVSGTGTVSAKKHAVKATKVLRCGHGKIKVKGRRHGKTIAMCVPKKTVEAVAVHRRRVPSFTG